MSGLPPSSEPGKSRMGRLLSIEVIGEIVLLAGVGAFFVYMFLDSWNWGLGAQILPWIAIGMGAPLWVWRVVSLFRAGLSEGSQIMDTGFLETDDPPAVVARRWVILILSTTGLLLSVWTLGFHVGIPLYTILYLIILGNMRWYWTVIPAAFFLAVIMFIYGQLLLAEWNVPHWIDWFGLSEWWDDRFDPDHTLRLGANYIVGVGFMVVVAFATEFFTRIARGSASRTG